MAVFTPIPLYLQIAQISQYLSQADSASDQIFRGGALNNNYTRLLRNVRIAVQWAYNRNPNDPAIDPIAVYMYQLCGKYAIQAQTILNNLAQSPPLVTGPANQSVTVGSPAVFTISVISSLSYTIAWYRNGVLIPGQTGLSYSLANAQLSDSGALFSAIVTSGAGPTPSAQASLAVTAALVALTWYGDIDPNPDLQAGIDNLAYQITTNITHNQPIVIVIPQAATPNKWVVTKVVSTESLKTIWNNTALNNGTINPPDGIFNAALQFGGNTFYPTHVTISLDYNNPLTLS
jgi:hypothetical protein